jgi:regulator of sirC expression with transglutaminase-like and TPR domain
VGERSVNLARIALEIARDAYPGLDVESQLKWIDALSCRVMGRCGSTSRTKAALGHINWVLFVEEGLRGDDESYYDPRNSYLNEILDRKLGIPISLSILYQAVARPVGIDLAGVNLPAHFVLRVMSERELLFVDPFHAGAILDRAGCNGLVSRAMGIDVSLPDEQFEPALPASIVARMLRNLKANYLREDDYAAALTVVRRLAALEPDDGTAQRDYGLIAYRNGRPGEALTPLLRYMDLKPKPQDAAAVLELIRAIRREIIESN